MIGRNGERGSGISALAARHDDDDDDEFSVFNALGPISNPTPPTVAFTEFFHADTVTSDHPLPVSCYLISSVCVYLCSCMHIMSILCSTADAISSGSCPILCKVLTLNVAICSVCLHFSSFGRLSSVADFSNSVRTLRPRGASVKLSVSNTEAKGRLSMRRPFFTRAKSDAVCVWGLSVGHGYLSMAVLFSSIEATRIEGSSSSPIELTTMSVKSSNSRPGPV